LSISQARELLGISKDKLNLEAGFIIIINRVYTD
jgi:hypothetical protein